MQERFPDPVPALKRRVADEILVLLDGWTQENAAAWLGVSQSRISELRRGKLDRYSLDRLVRWLATLGRRVDIITAEGTRRSGLNNREVDEWVAAREERDGSP